MVRVARRQRRRRNCDEPVLGANRARPAQKWTAETEQQLGSGKRPSGEAPAVLVPHAEGAILLVHLGAAPEAHRGAKRGRGGHLIRNALADLGNRRGDVLDGAKLLKTG